MEKINNIELYDIYSTWHIPFFQTVWFSRTLITLGIVIVGSLTAWLIIRYLKKKILPKSAWQIALEQLHVLQKKGYTTKAAGKQCYFTMTSIIKEYLHAQHQLRTIGKTDEELIRYLQKSSLLTQPIIKRLEEICSGCLYIKFANQEAVQKQITLHLELSVQIIQETKPQEPQAC